MTSRDCKKTLNVCEQKGYEYEQVKLRRFNRLNGWRCRHIKGILFDYWLTRCISSYIYDKGTRNQNNINTTTEEEQRFTLTNEF